MTGGEAGPAPDGLPRLSDVLRAAGLIPKKSLGQNFILDLNLTRRIVREAAPLAGRTIIEIGPGPGGLTRALLMEGAGRVIAIERDDRCLEPLGAISDRYPGRLIIHAADALDTDYNQLLLDSAGKAAIVANLPYGVATKLLIGWLLTEPWPPWFDLMVLMFQREVAQRITAEPGSKAYGRLAVISQWRCEASIALTLPPEAFTPSPKVASAVVTFRPRAVLDPVCSAKTLGRVTAAAFGQRRKMLRQSLKQITPVPELLLREVDLDPEMRGERVTVQQFARLAVVLDRLQSRCS